MKIVFSFVFAAITFLLVQLGFAQTNTMLRKKATTLTKYDIQMVKVEGGMFTMGCTAVKHTYGCSDNSKPAHKVRLNEFYIGKYEITQAEWQAVMGYNPSFQKGENLPVDNVSWDEAQDFINKLNAKTGKHYRLPTEAEWEYAARGGIKSKDYEYSGSDNLSDVGWHYDNSGDVPHPIGTKLPNELGIYDMSGNVFEWCSDWYSDSYSSELQINPTGAAFGTEHIIRGGACGHYPGYCSVTGRYFGQVDEETRYKYTGFRLATSQ